MENSIAVISFENQTGDKTLDNYRKVIPSLLITNLEQTQGFSYVTSAERMRDILKQVGKGDTEFIDSRRRVRGLPRRRGESPRHGQFLSGPARLSSRMSKSWM